VLAAMGVAAGDRVGVLLPQRPETAIAHLAIYKFGAIALPLFTQFGPDALEHRLGDSGAKALITDGENLANLPAGLSDLAAILVVDETNGGDSGGNPLFWPSLERAADTFTPRATGIDDPALVIYTSGTTGKPKGALHAHRVLLGHLPGVQLAEDFFPASGDCYWTPADWAWIGGLLDVLLPSLYFGHPGAGSPRAQIRPRRGLRADGAARCQECLSAADGTQDDAPGGTAARALRPSPALGGERRRSAWRGHPRLVPRTMQNLLASGA
jgi:acetyl-CoA synthetase